MLFDKFITNYSVPIYSSEDEDHTFYNLNSNQILNYFQMFPCQYAQYPQRGAPAAARRWSPTYCPGLPTSLSWPWRKGLHRSHHH